MSGINFAGLATGIDSEAIIAKLVSVERARIAPYQRQRTAFERQNSILSDLITKLKSLKTQANLLDTKTELSAFTAVSADNAVFTATASGAAAPGTYDIKVSELAQGTQTRIGKSGTNGFDADIIPTSGTGSGTGNIQLTVNGTTANFAYSPGKKLQEIVDAINADTNINNKVSANLINTGGTTPKYFILVTGRNTGAANAVTVADDQSPDKLSINEEVAAADAKVVVDGITVFRPDNKISDLFPGITLELKKVDNGGTKLTINRDLTTEAANVQKLVDTFNAVATVVKQQLSYTGTVKGPDTLFGDATVRNLQGRIQSVIATTYGGVSPRELGIATGVDGTLSFDSTKFQAAIAADHSKLENTFAGAGGLAAALGKLVDDFTKAGSSETDNGFLIARQKGIDTRMKTLDETIDRIDRKAEQLGDRLRRIFANLESTISLMKGQGDQLLTALNSR